MNLRNEPTLPNKEQQRQSLLDSEGEEDPTELYDAGTTSNASNSTLENSGAIPSDHT